MKQSRIGHTARMRCLVHTLLWIVSKIFELTFWPMKIFQKFRRPKRCPPIEDDVLLIPAVVLAEKIRNRHLSSENVVRSYARRVREVNSILNAVVEDRFEEAIEEAKNVDSFLTDCEMSEEELAKKYPLLGVPVTVKESIAVKNCSFNAGMTGPRRKNATEDADVVKLIKDAGAVVLLKSNTPEWCLNWETVNKYTGRTVNPYDSRKTCGGSSGGEAVLLASAASILGVGSDVAGSLRLPPHFCGVFGHKPTPQVISNAGNIPYTDVEYVDFYLLTGPMTRYASDLPLLLDVMLKPDKKNVLNLSKHVDPKSIKIYYMEHDGGSFLTHFVQADIVKATRKAINLLKADGFFVKKAHFKEMSDSIDLAFLPLLNIEGINSVFDDGNRSLWLESLKTVACSASVEPNSILFKIIGHVTRKLCSKKRLETINQSVKKLRECFQEMLKDDGVFLYPTFPSVAHFHGEIFSKTCDTSYMAIFNVLGFPVTVCPIGFSSNGLPIGIQIAGNFCMDHLCFAVAKILEDVCGGWKPPPDSKHKHPV